MKRKSCFKSFHCTLLLCFLAATILFRNINAQTDLIIPGGDWRDTNGKLIAATEGGIIKVDSLFYLWGEDRSANNYGFVGVNLYSSPDLKSWTFVNQILKKASHTDLNNDAVIERAKILHNKKTGQFIMWMHYEGHNAYSVAEVGYATCNTIGGNYTFQSHFRPMDIDSRDMNVYQDDDGKAYLICTTKGNQNVSLFELDSTYTKIVKEVYRGSASDDMECEGHAIIKTGGYYFWLMSWCTSWDFNDNHYFYASSLAGPWTAGGNIAVTNTHTYESQVGFAVTVKGSQKTTFLYTGDRWSVDNYGMSRIVLLPIDVNGTKLSVNWQDQYDIDPQTGEWTPGSKAFIDGVYSITAKHSGMALGTNGSAVQQQTFTGADNQLWRIQNVGASHFKISSVSGGKVMDISGASREVGAKLLQYDWNDGYNQKWQIIDCGNGYHRLVNVNTLGKSLEIAGSSKTAGTDATLGDFAYKDNQLWRIAAVNKDVVSGNTYMIENRAGGNALDAGAAAGKVTQSTPAKLADQVWKVEDLFNGYYKITTSTDGKAIDCRDSTGDGSAVYAGDSSGRFSQEWEIVQVESGWYKLINRYSGKVFDNKDGSKAEGSPVIQNTDKASSSTSQQWKFVSVDKVSVDRSSHLKFLESISGNGAGNGCLVYDLHGRVIYRGTTFNKQKQAVLSHGVYLVKRSAEKGRLRINKVLIE